MPFTAHDLRYHLEQSFPALYTYLQRRAKHYLGSLRFDPNETDLVVEHVIEQLVRLGVLGGGDHEPENALDRLSPAQFYSFLNHSVRNKAIDRLRKHRLPVSTFTELETSSDTEAEYDPLNDEVEPVGGTIPFATPEDAALALVSQKELRLVLKHCIEALREAPHQLQAVLQELEDLGASELLQQVRSDVGAPLAGTQGPAPAEPLAHASQNKDHAHKKLRLCLQKSSTNLAVIVALRLTHYNVSTTTSKEVAVDLQALAQDDLSIREVQMGLRQLATEGLLDWHGEEVVRLTQERKKRLARFYVQE